VGNVLVEFAGLSRLIFSFFSSGYRKFIKCDKCSKWYHPRCIGLTAKKADALSTYACPACQKSPAYRDFLFRPLIGDDSQIPQSVVLDIKKNRVAGPFLQPVDPIQAPDYYREIAEPMGTFTKHCLSAGLTRG
jgi:hypothetical protein